MEMEEKNESTEVKASTPETQETKKPGMGFILTLTGIGLVLGMVVSFITVIAVKETSGVNFCSSCHSMKPMAEAYRNSVHGGYGDSGIRAKCADCHLPHESTMGYMIQKVRTGMWDVYMETTHPNTDLIDWQGKREERREWVYDSGCLHCHENLLRGTRPNKKAFIAHKAYFADKLVVEEHGEKVPAKCVDCHKHVGHYDLDKQLAKHLPHLAEDEMTEVTETQSEHH